MSVHVTFSLSRFWAIVVKEFIQMRRDRLTFAMIIGIPTLQLSPAASGPFCLPVH